MLLRYEFGLGHSAKESTDNICLVKGPGAVSYITARRWFARFRQGNFNIEDEPHVGRPLSVNDDELLKAVDADPRLTTRDLSVMFSCSNVTITNRLHELGLKWKYGIWKPHVLSPANLNDRANTAASLLTKCRRIDWLDKVITADEKWVLYINVAKKRMWLRSQETAEQGVQADPHEKKIMLCVWWSVHGIDYMEFMDDNTTVTANVYCEQLQRAADALSLRRPQQRKVYFLHDNARPHIAKIVRQKITDLSWELLHHPPYSPDMAPTDYHLFRSLQNHLTGKKFINRNELEAEVCRHFTSLPPDFYREGIYKLRERWQYIVDHDGDYYAD
jgi:histone-lysine N-methyltransferase SETMAR